MHHFARSVAILIGINDYRNGVPALRTPVHDVQALGRLLVEAHGYDVRIVLDSEATLSGLRALLSALPGQLSADDRVLLYFAGHGTAEELGELAAGPRGFILPQDARSDDVESFLSMTELQRALAALPCRHLLLILDCCFAGAFRWSQTRDLRVRARTLYRERFERYVRDPAWQVLASAAHDERALDVVAGRVLGSRDEREQGSPFATALLHALRGDADLRVGGQPGDGVIVADELHLFLEGAFARLEVQLGRCLQKPLLWSLAGRDKGQYVFLVPGRALVLASALDLNEKNNPYRGLESYEEIHSTLFFGRAAVADELYACMVGRPLTVVVGGSGTGKSSLVRAGVLPRLRRAQPPSWTILSPQRPGSRPLEMLASVTALLAPGAASLAAAFAEWRRTHPTERALIFIDQAEEVVTQANAELDAFTAALLAAREACGEQVHVLLALRSDYEPHFKRLLAPAAGAGESPRFLVRAMTRAELREAIEGPASERVLYFEPPELVDSLIDEVINTPGALPLLSFLLSEMYRASLQRPLDRTLSEADYQRLGGVAGALSQRADKVYEVFAAEPDRRAFRHLMLRQVAPGETARRRVSEAELRFADPAQQERVDRITACLLAERLLIPGTDIRGERFVEPAHDKLVLGWPQLRSFLAADRLHQLHHGVIEAAQRWEASGKDGAYLWDRDPQLPLALALRRGEPDRLNRREQEFIRGSARRRLFKRVLAASGVVVALVAVTVWALQIRAKNRSLVEQHHAITIEQGRQELLAGRPSQALLWLNQAYQGGSHRPDLLFMLAQATRSADAMVLSFAQHRNDVVGVAFGPDGSRVITASWDGTARIWDPRDGTEFHAFDHATRLNAVAFAPKGRRVAVAGQDGIVHVRDAYGGQLLESLPGPGEPVTAVAFDRAGLRLAVAYGDNSVVLWDLEKRAPRRLTCPDDPTRPPTALAFDPQNSFLFSVGGELFARVWDPVRGTCKRTLGAHDDDVTAIAFGPAPEGWIVTGSRDRTAKIWTRAGASHKALIGHGDWVNAVAFSPDGTRVATAGADRTIRLWDPRTGELLDTLEGHNDAVDAITFSPDGLILASAGADDRVILWRATNGPWLYTLPADDAVRSIAFGPGEKRIATGADDGHVRLFDDGALVKDLPAHPGQRVDALVYSRDAAAMLTRGEQLVVVWTADGDLLHELRPPSGAAFRAAAINHDATRVVTGDSAGAVHIWNAGNGAPERSLVGHSNAVIAADFAADGQTLVTASWDGTAWLWATTTGQPLHTLTDPSIGSTHADQLTAAMFSPDGKLVLTASKDKTAKLWDVASGELRSEFARHQDGITAVAFHPERAIVATASQDMTARLWKLTDGELLHTLADQSPVNAVAFSGALVVTASAGVAGSGTAKLWDLMSGKLLAVLGGHRSNLTTAAFSPDGRRLLTASHENAARVWDVRPEERPPPALDRLVRCRLPWDLAAVREDPPPNCVVDSP